MGRESAAATVMVALRAGPDSGRYGVDLLRDTGLTSGRLYSALVRLERAGLIESGWQDNGRRRYLLTPTGVTTAKTRGPETLGTATRPGVWWLPAAAVAAVESHAALTRPIGARLSDLAIYRGAINGLRDGASLYADTSAHHATFTYPPFAGLVLWPVSLATPLPLQVAWTVLTVGAVVALSMLAARSARVPRAVPAAAIAAALMLSAPVSSALHFGQVSIMLAALVVADTVGLRDSRCQGVLVGFAAAVKLTPLIFIPMLWLAGRRRAALVAASTFGACGALAWAALPADSWRFWSAHVWHPSRLGPITSVGNQSFNGTLMRLGMTGPSRSVAALLVGGAVAAVALRRAGRLGRGGEWLSATTVVGAASIVISPVSWTHHQAWLVMAALVPVRGSARAQAGWSAAALGVMILPVTALGPPLWSNARMLTAIIVACAIPVRRPDAGLPRTREEEPRPAVRPGKSVEPRVDPCHPSSVGPP